MKSLGPLSSTALCATLLVMPGIAGKQEGRPQTYKLSIVENAGITKRVKKNRVSSQAVVKVTDENDIPVAGIGVAFTITQVSGGAAGFTGGTATAFVTTNAAGLASSGTILTVPTSSFAVGVTASVPGGTLSLTVPVNVATALAGGAAGTGAGAGASAGAGVGTATATTAGLSAAAIGGITAGVAAAVVGVVVGVAKSSGSKTPSAGSTTARGTIGLGTGTVFGPPH